MTTHATHLWIALGLLLVYAVLGLVRKQFPAASADRGGGRSWRGIARGALTVAVGAGCLVAVNFAQTGRAFFSRGGHVYLFAHLIDTGLAQRLLREECPGAGYAFCPYRSGLDVSAADFIWGNRMNVPLLGGWARSNGEAERVLRGVIRRYPVDYAASVVTYTARQFAALNTFDGLETYADKPYVTEFLAHYLPAQYGDFLAAAQQRNAFAGSPGLPALHAAVFWLAVLASGALLVMHRRRGSATLRDPALLFLLTVWLALLGNAALCANVSGVFDRYQTRLAWLLPLAVMLAFARWPRASAAIERGAPVQP